MYKRAGPVAEILLERGKISLTGMEISPYKHSNGLSPPPNRESLHATQARTSPVAGMKVQR
jgi:hypothetical protein